MRALRPEQGFPLRLIVPGWQGINNVKWLRRIYLVDQPHMVNMESTKYPSPRPDRRSRWFENEMGPKSVINFAFGWPETLHSRLLRNYGACLVGRRCDPEEWRSLLILAKPGGLPSCRDRSFRRHTLVSDWTGIGMGKNVFCNPAVPMIAGRYNQVSRKWARSGELGWTISSRCHPPPRTWAILTEFNLGRSPRTGAC